jgi:hypothetical protein
VTFTVDCTQGVWSGELSQNCPELLDFGRYGAVRRTVAQDGNDGVDEAEVVWDEGNPPGLTGKEVARPAGVEPATFGSVDQRSIQLSYGRITENNKRLCGDLCKRALAR